MAALFSALRYKRRNQTKRMKTLLCSCVSFRIISFSRVPDATRFIYDQKKAEAAKERDAAIAAAHHGAAQ